MTQYRPVPPQVDLPALERDVLDFWREQQTFEKSVAAQRAAPSRGPSTRARRPPTAGPAPTTSRRARSRTSSRASGPCRATRSTARAAGTATACPVELAVEKELGFSGKADIEALRRRGVQRPLPRVRAAPRRPLGADDRPDGLLGRHARALPDDGRRLRRVGLVGAASRSTARACCVEDYRVAPYCPRCGTGLSDHELAQGYETVTDPSVYVRFPLTSGPYAGTRGAADLDHDPVDAGLQRAGRRAPGRSTYVTATQRRGDPGRRRGAGRQGAGRGLDGRGHVHAAPTWSAGPTSAPSS